jgi:hypothetical protein
VKAPGKEKLRKFFELSKEQEAKATSPKRP